MVDYNIRMATEKDIPSIMKYIDINWKKNHILARDRKLFTWQYDMNGKVNMIIGEDLKGNIQGVLGYIPYSTGNNKDYSLALWKANEGTSFLGIRLLLYLMENEKCRCVFCNGINLATTKLIYERMGFEIKKLNQWYRLNNCEHHEVGYIVDKTIPMSQIFSEIKLEKAESFEKFEKNSSKMMFSKELIPYKSREYIKNRYFDHVSYNYIIYNVCQKDILSDTAIVFRIQNYKNSKILRIVDVLGDYKKLALVTGQIDMLLNKYDAEYVDIYEYGLDSDILRNAGWTRVGDNKNIIPNYFAPYLLSNIDIYISTTNENIVLFKGDGDQDRPN